jgi:hypothetical protein
LETRANRIPDAPHCLGRPWNPNELRGDFRPWSEVYLTHFTSAAGSAAQFARAHWAAGSGTTARGIAAALICARAAMLNGELRNAGCRAADSAEHQFLRTGLVVRRHVVLARASGVIAMT